MPTAIASPLDCVRQLVLFEGCESQFLQGVSATTTREFFKPGEVIIREGTEDSSLRVVCRGVVEVEARGRAASEASEGAAFGESHVLGVLHRASATLRAKTAVDMQVLSRTHLGQLLTRYPRERTLLGQTAARRKLERLEKVKKIPRGHRLKEQVGRNDRSAKRPSSVAARGSGGREAHQSLSDWHRQLASGALGRRLHLSTLDSPSLQHVTGGSKGQRQLDERSASPNPPVRPSSELGGAMGSSFAPAQLPYPRLPRSPPLPLMRRHGDGGSDDDGSCFQQERQRHGRPGFMGGGPRRRRYYRSWESPLEGDPSIDTFSASGCYQSFSSSAAAQVPPLSGQGQAVVEVSLGAARSQQQQSQQRPRSTPSPPCDILAVVAHSLGNCSTVVVPLGPQRRLEVTLRGAFQRRQAGMDQEEDEEDANDCRSPQTYVSEDYECDEDEDGRSTARCGPRAATATATIRRGSDGGGSAKSGEGAGMQRERMGFGRFEDGAVPSGRSSVPAVRGSKSAPPVSCPAAVDEGIELEILESRLEHHIRRLLERGLRAPSRAPSCEPVAQEASPEPFSPPRSLCPSPVLGFLNGMEEGLQEDAVLVGLAVRVRLCRSRCGSSSAVLELLLEHGPECSEVRGCLCRPTPTDAEARLLAHFGRYQQLRLTSAQPPVRVFLEPLPDEVRASTKESVDAAAREL